MYYFGTVHNNLLGKRDCETIVILINWRNKVRYCQTRLNKSPPQKKQTNKQTNNNNNDNDTKNEKRILHLISESVISAVCVSLTEKKIVFLHQNTM